MKQLMQYDMIMMRGAQGSGKSTMAKKIQQFLESRGKSVKIVEADNFFMVNGEYRFNPALLHLGHKSCQAKAKFWHLKGYTVIVANTNTSKREFEAYQAISDNLCAVLCTGRYENAHGVPNDKVEVFRMKCLLPIEDIVQFKDTDLQM